MNQEVITITYGDQAENHVGMQKIGELASEGFHLSELHQAKTQFEKSNVQCELIDLTQKLKDTYNPTETLNSSSKRKTKTPEFEDAHILIIRGGVNHILKKLNKTHENMYTEQKNLNYDTKAFMYGRIVNKTARYNICFSGIKQDADYENGKGTIVAFKDVKLTNYIRSKLNLYLGDKAKNLKAEGNYYYDVNKCGISFHGDIERMKVIGIRLGNTSLPVHYQWFYQNNYIGDRIILDLHPGDIYVMCQKTTGNDWKKKNIYTLRHATGAPKYLKIKEKQIKFSSKLMKELEKYNEDELNKMFETIKNKRQKEAKKEAKAKQKILDETPKKVSTKKATAEDKTEVMKTLQNFYKTTNQKEETIKAVENVFDTNVFDTNVFDPTKMVSNEISVSNEINQNSNETPVYFHFYDELGVELDFS
jgi:hypothetical protein